MQVTSQLYMDLTTPGLMPVLEGVQGDSARVVALTLTENGKPWEIPQDVRVMVRYRHESGQGGVFDTLPDGKAAYSFTGNVLTLTLPSQAWGEAGSTKVQAVLLQEDRQLSVFAFALQSERAYAGSVEGEYTNVSAWLQEVANKKLWQNIPKVTQKYMFAGPGWNVNTFFPCRSISFSGAYTDYMFSGHGVGSGHYDLAQRLEQCGVIFDFSQVTRANYMFYDTAFTRLPVLNLSGCSKLQRTFGYNRALVCIDCLQVSEKTTFDNPFEGSEYLKNLTISGTIGQNGFDVSVCPLTRESLLSILNALKEGVSDRTVTLGEANLAKLTDSEKSIATDKGWMLQ